MAFKKTLVERLFNISKSSSTQTLRNCRISSSAIHLRPAAKPRESTIAPDPGDNAVFRRFIHKGGASLPEIWSVPVGDSLLEKIRSVGISGSRIRLDGLAPPTKMTAPERDKMSATAVVAGLTAEETRKLLRAAQMEAVKAKLRAVQKPWIPYSEFVRICTEGCSDPDQGLGFAKSLDESGSVIVLGNAVCIKPKLVAKAIQDLIPIPGAKPTDARMNELEGLKKQKSLIDQKADALVRRELWLGLGYLVVQTAVFLRLTFWELSWDVMEPICFYVTSMYFMAGYAFFLRTSKEPSFEGFFESRFKAKQTKLMKKHDFDFGRYEELRKACDPYSSASSAELSNLSTAFDGPKKMQMQFGSNVL